jgi:hypothetical protein
MDTIANGGCRIEPEKVIDDDIPGEQSIRRDRNAVDQR